MADEDLVISRNNTEKVYPGINADMIEQIAED